MMQIQGITLREISMKLVVPFETSMDRLVVRRIVLLEAHVDTAGIENMSIPAPTTSRPVRGGRPLVI